MDVDKTPAFRDGHAAPLIQVLAWLFISFSALSVLSHFATKKAMSRPFTKADGILSTALILDIGQAITFLSPAGQAIGNSQSDYPKNTIMQAWKAMYIGDILFVSTLVAAKLSLLVPFTTVTPVVKHRVMMYTTSAVTVVWGITAVFLIAFQCPSPQRWDIENPQCMDFRSIRTFNAVMNIVTDLALVTVPTLMVIPLQVGSDRKLTLLVGFWCRLIVVGASAVQIFFISNLSLQDSNLLNTIWPIVVSGQVVKVTSIMTSTIPFLKPFLVSLESSLTLNPSSVIHTTTLGYKTTGSTGRHPSSYIKIGTPNSQGTRSNKLNNIWVSADFEVKGEPSMELSERRGN
ncbi:hypothetical protein COCC4DRAFT_49222 [Bipolaris maydis ATCC 48331]|uniref:Rhodopsin domain-containing protein n=2 Tax=Cochliobolus heterostrophus TaxID=5016 RepID=M2TLF0_COCH5|nr:uncharacterized protein COCC4DRAFT_49222 [Bipolaris maydis ATCC 48331]EMD87314.1 hypothetical protein COCHEDRAFT_1184164 [Bipolaris maydis C5]KAH7554724.1 hypothetical protein BM1_07385 [Bipolaris maydis]ENI06513.1 hypothetical protein COCC4DRAFT_49222 [Bipolaris maydis ATCC 48331]KAJ5023390.1 hypothetical protein J3E73DRAFT_384753 [Bipolaris maydis]KAJ5055857.1 hypothetical protein J3E74DRAFT_421668 [Bipolaris maydis]